ncbi:AAA family ATPase [Pseudomonas aeruginosa]|nr:AAA family ATPase [Pseudomonas aeruginosa]
MLNTLEACLKAVDEILLGKDRQVRLALACLLARGHLLIEDLPGMGKTTLSHALARVLGLSFQRIQFTSDLLPGDILGTSVFDKDSGQFVFHPGPIFAELVLADEINRATPKSQSALLEAMEEGQVTIEGATRPLPEPFFVIATQNPASQGGTFSLPESQLDRFLMRLSLGYPGRAAERSLLLGEARRDLLPRLEPLLDHAALAAFQAEVPKVRASDALVDYVLRLVEATRTQPAFALGLSPRGSLALLAAARAWALLAGRDYVIPEDVQAVLPAVAGHRLRDQADPTGHGGGALVQWLLREVPALLCACATGRAGSAG